MDGQSVVLQFGESSNLAAAHFWNSISKQADFYKSLGDESSDFTARRLLCAATGEPRNVIFDIKQKSFHLQQDDSKGSEAIRSGWRTRSFVKYHQRSFVPVDDTALVENYMIDTREFDRGCSRGQEAECIELGLDAIRIMAEECDRLDRFLILSENVGFWGGFSTEILMAVLDEFGPTKSFDLFPLFCGLDLDHHRPYRSVLCDVALNMVHTKDISTRTFPLLLKPMTTTNIEASLCQIAGLLETFLTTDLFKTFNHKDVPLGMNHTWFGTAENGKVPMDSIKDLTLGDQRVTNDWRLGRVTESTILDDQDYYNVPIYLSSPLSESLISSSAEMRTSSKDNSPLRQFIKNDLIIPIRNDHNIRSQFTGENDWREICEELEGIASPV